MNKNYLIGIIVLVLLSGIQNVSAVADPLEVYTKTINTNPEGYYQSIEAIVDNGDNTYTTIGNTNRTGTPSVILTKLDSSGNELANRTYNVNLENFTLKLIKTTDGGYMFSGTGGMSSVVVKIKSNLDFDWQYNYHSGTLFTFFTNAIQTSDGGYAMVDAIGTTVHLSS
jgi:hypothetical protein